MNAAITPELRLITKVQLANQLGVSYSCLRKYHDMIYFKNKEFREDYSLINMSRYTRDRMTNYQCWVCSRVIADFQGRATKVIEAMLANENFAERYTKKAFFAYYNSQTLRHLQ